MNKCENTTIETLLLHMEILNPTKEVSEREGRAQNEVIQRTRPQQRRGEKREDSQKDERDETTTQNTEDDTKCSPLERWRSHNVTFLKRNNHVKKAKYKNSFPSLVNIFFFHNFITDAPNCHLIRVPALATSNKRLPEMFLCSTCRGGLQGASCRRRAGSTSHSGARHEHKAVLGVRPQTCGVHRHDKGVSVAPRRRGKTWTKQKPWKHKEEKKNF